MLMGDVLLSLLCLVLEEGIMIFESMSMNVGGKV